MDQKNNKVALITGAARRIGASIAQYLHDCGMNVIIHYHQSADDAEKLVAQACQKRPNSMIGIKADLRDMAQINQLAKQAQAQWGSIDLLVNNASCFYPTRLETINEAIWHDVLDCNTKAPFFLSQALVPALKQSRGNIISITDVHASVPLKHHSVYCMSKAALAMLTQALARDLAPRVRVNAIAPGVTLWPDQPSNTLDEVQKQHLMQRVPLQTTGDPQQIAQTVWYISEQAKYMTGEVITLDGGRHLQD